MNMDPENKKKKLVKVTEFLLWSHQKSVTEEKKKGKKKKEEQKLKMA